MTDCRPGLLDDCMLYLTIHYPEILNDAVPWMSGSLSLDKEQLKIEMVDSFDLGIEY